MARDGDLLEWEGIRYFLRAAEAKSLSGAARSLGVQHTTVGRRLAGLERVLGSALVERTPSGLEVTRLGRRALRLAGEMDRVARAIANLAADQRSTVRLVIPTGFTALLTPRLEALSHEHPDLALEIVSSARKVDLAKGEADLAIRVGPIDDESLVARKLGDVPSALYGSRAYLARRKDKVDPDDLRDHAVIGFHRSLAATPSAQWLRARAGGAKVVMRSRQAVDMLMAARSGAGLAVLPCFLADAEPTLLRLTDAPIAVRRVSLVYQRNASLSSHKRAVIRFIIEALRDQAWTQRAE